MWSWFCWSYIYFFLKVWLLFLYEFVIAWFLVFYGQYLRLCFHGQLLWFVVLRCRPSWWTSSVASWGVTSLLRASSWLLQTWTWRSPLWYGYKVRLTSLVESSATALTFWHGHPVTHTQWAGREGRGDTRATMERGLLKVKEQAACHDWALLLLPHTHTHTTCAVGPCSSQLYSRCTKIDCVYLYRTQ